MHIENICMFHVSWGEWTFGLHVATNKTRRKLQNLGSTALIWSRLSRHDDTPGSEVAEQAAQAIMGDIGGRN